ncbi:outer membrane insertion C- signal [Reichenbachiella faecimaris]|nr:outer membrane insertion C- signal [Reichenbachiella faecimaris]
MKKILVLTVVFVSILSSARAQEVGIRLGDVLGNDAAVDAIFSIGDFSRIHADASFGKQFGESTVGLEVLYDFFYKPVGDVPGLNWYIGVGPSVLIANDLFLGASGEIGIEYHFDFPLALGADWRPTFWLIEETDFRGDSFGINARYVFGK